MKYCILLSCFLLPLIAGAQLTDSTLLKKAALFSELNRSTHWFADNNQHHYLRPTQIAFPVAAIMYGFASLKSRELKQINLEAREEIQEHHNQFKAEIDNYLQFGPAVSVYALNAAGITTTHNFRERTLLLGMSTLLMAGTVATLKKITRQQRPDGSSYNSFPSGHTATAFSGAAFMRLELQRHSSLLSYSGYAMAGGTAVLRMYNNRHWLADVVAGAGIGILSTRMSYWLFDKIKKSTSKNPHTILL